MENVGAGNLSMPEQEMHTTSFWLHFPAEFLAQFADLAPSDKQGGIAGIGNALRTVAALLLMCDPRDLGLSIGTQEDRAYEPNLFLYDNYPGGIGQSAPLFQLAERALAQTKELIAACPCADGCPSCVGPVGEIGEKGKSAALRILSALGG
jgi:DEAD/DEAH box helicase domain-containing protein